MQRIALLSLAGLLTYVAVGLTACSDRVTSPADSDLIEVRVSPPWQSVAVGNTVRFTASMDPGASVTDRTVTWSSSDTTVATVDQTGTLTGVKPGNATIVARSNENPAVAGAGLVTVAAGFVIATISAVTTKICTTSGGCTSMPANLDSIAGQVDIVVGVEPNGQVLKTVQATLTCGSKSLSAQRTGLDVAPAPLPAVALIALSINTLQVDATGAPKLPNGACTLSASASTASGTQSVVNTVPLILKNTR